MCKGREILEHSVLGGVSSPKPSPQDPGSYAEEEVGRLKEPEHWKTPAAAELIHSWAHSGHDSMGPAQVPARLSPSSERESGHGIPDTGSHPNQEAT